MDKKPRKKKVIKAHEQKRIDIDKRFAGRPEILKLLKALDRLF